MYRDKGQNLALIHLHGLTRRQIIRNDNGWLHAVPVKLLLAAQIPDQAIGDILHIRGSCLHVLIIHACKHLGEIIAGHSHSILCVHLLVLNHGLNGFLIVIVLEHHLMNLKNSRIHLADLLQSFLIKPAELLERKFLCGFQAFQFFLRLRDMRSLDETVLLLQNIDRTDCRAFIHGLSSKLFHVPLFFRSLSAEIRSISDPENPPEFSDACVHRESEILLEEFLQCFCCCILIRPLCLHVNLIILLHAHAHDRNQLRCRCGLALALQRHRALKLLRFLHQQTCRSCVQSDFILDDIRKFLHLVFPLLAICIFRCFFRAFSQVPRITFCIKILAKFYQSIYTLTAVLRFVHCFFRYSA